MGAGRVLQSPQGPKTTPALQGPGWAEEEGSLGCGARREEQ